jgi:hypothetical protein
LLVLFAGAALVAMAIAAMLVWGVPYEHVTVVLDGERIDIPPLTAGHWLVASAVVLFLLAVLLVIVPLALAIGLAVPLGLFALALAAAAALTAVALSPLLLLGWIVWRLARRPRASPTLPAPGAAAPPRSPG